MIPTHLVIEDTRAAYAARYHSIVPEGQELRALVLKAYGGVCVCCGCDEIEQLTLDHIEPVRGGARRKFLALWKAGFPKDNLQVMCGPCNTAKGAGKCCPHSVIARHAAFYILMLSQGEARALIWQHTAA